MKVPCCSTLLWGQGYSPAPEPSGMGFERLAVATKNSRRPSQSWMLHICGLLHLPLWPFQQRIQGISCGKMMAEESSGNVVVCPPTLGVPPLSQMDTVGARQIELCGQRAACWAMKALSFDNSHTEGMASQGWSSILKQETQAPSSNIPPKPRRRGASGDGRKGAQKETRSEPGPLQCSPLTPSGLGGPKPDLAEEHSLLGMRLRF